MIIACTIFLATCVAFLYWRYVWFFRNPDRMISAGESFVSPADGTVVYCKRLRPDDEVITIKQGVEARIEDIAKEHIEGDKILIGIFMSPFDVHYNRAPIAGTIEAIHHYPAKTENRHMGPMHLRILLGRSPFYDNSLHIIENERTVTRIKGSFRGVPTECYVIQIAGKSVRGIDSYVPIGDPVARGQIFGMIRIGSQVDVVIPDWGNAVIKVKTGDRVRAGESVLIE
ncbi:MAG: phosphatidylserine decarboxylase [Thermodesulfobacteriota bacterium]|nr:phosphatidylserine decarboxylase [Thermodesulfobacteriota bacterium]